MATESAGMLGRVKALHYADWLTGLDSPCALPRSHSCQCRGAPRDGCGVQGRIYLDGLRWMTGCGKGSESLDPRNQLGVAHPLVVLLRPENQSAEGASIGEPAVRDDFHVRVVAHEDTAVPRGALEVHGVRRSRRIDVNRANEIPTSPTKREDQWTVDVGVSVEREPTGHYRSRDSAQDLSAPSSASISS